MFYIDLNFFSLAYSSYLDFKQGMDSGLMTLELLIANKADTPLNPIYLAVINVWLRLRRRRPYLLQEGLDNIFS